MCSSDLNNGGKDPINYIIRYYRTDTVGNPVDISGNSIYDASGNIRKDLSGNPIIENEYKPEDTSASTETFSASSPTICELKMVATLII